MLLKHEKLQRLFQDHQEFSKRFLLYQQLLVESFLLAFNSLLGLSGDCVVNLDDLSVVVLKLFLHLFQGTTSLLFSIAVVYKQSMIAHSLARC